MATGKAISDATSLCATSIKSILKLLTSSRRGRSIDTSTRQSPLIIMGNGPSLRQTIAQHSEMLRKGPAMAVNFAAVTPEFCDIKPEYYVLADPHFGNTTDPNVERLIEALNNVTHKMTLLLPHGFNTSAFTNENLDIRHFPAVGVEGCRWLRHFAIRHKLGMPRPRNVLVCAIMCGIWLGFKEIYITGADHTWTQTLSVNDNNEVVSIQPHFYNEPTSEKDRVTAVYRDVRIHEILNSFSIAFKAYHDIADYATPNGIFIHNATPGSFIDAFKRKELP